MTLVQEQEGCRRRFVAPFRHADHRAIDRVEVRDPVGTIPAEIVRLNKIRSFRIVSLYERWLARHFSDSDATAQIVETVGTEEQEEGVASKFGEAEKRNVCQLEPDWRIPQTR